MKDIEQRVLDAIDVEGMLVFLCELIGIPSHSGHESAAQEFVAAKLVSLGMKVDKWDIDLEALSKHPAFSMFFERKRGLGVVGMIGGGNGGRNLILNGHIDTVASGDEANWLYPPFKGTIEDGRVIGRGVCDMKGGLSCAIFAAKAILDAGVKIKGSLIIESVIGEEDGGVGSLATILRGYSSDGAIVMEPSEAKVAPAHAGALSFRVTVSGKAAHACVREEGVSAIDKFILIYNSLRDLEIERNSSIKHPLFERYETPYALNVGTVHGGEWPGSVAESLVFDGRIGVAVGEKVEEARKTLEKAVAEAAASDPWLKDHPPIVQWRGYQFDSASISTDEQILQTVVEAYSDATGVEAELEGMTYASDMRHLINTGNTPTLIFGPGNVRNAHSTNEYVLIKELNAVVRTLVLTILRFCGYKED